MAINKTQITAYQWADIFKQQLFPLDDGSVIISSDGEQLHFLNATASLIWDLWDQGHTQEQIATQMAEQFTIDYAQAIKDVQTVSSEWLSCSNNTLYPTPETDSPVTVEFNSTADDVDSYARGYQFSGITFVLRYTSHKIERAIIPLFAHLASVDKTIDATVFDLIEDGDSNYTIFSEGKQVETNMDHDRFVLCLCNEIVCLSHRNRDCLAVLHAAAVALGDECIVLPGLGGSGKSTLTAFLAYGGLSYLGDDVLPLDGSGHAVPVPLCLNLKSGSLPVLAEYLPKVNELTAYQREDQPLHFLPPPRFDSYSLQNKYAIRSLVFPCYVPEITLSLTPMSATEVLQGLVLAESLFERPLNPDKVGGLVEWVQTIPGYRLEYSNLFEAQACIKALFKS